MGQTTTLVQGLVYRDETYILIRWGWLTFLALEILLAHAFLIVTILWTRRSGTPVLKTSSLGAMLILSDEARRAVGTIDRFDEAKQRSKRVKVRLRGNQIVLEEKESLEPR